MSEPKKTGVGDLPFEDQVPCTSMLLHVLRVFWANQCCWWMHLFYAMELSCYIACLFVPSGWYFEVCKFIAAIHFGSYVVDHLRLAYVMRRYRCIDDSDL